MSRQLRCRSSALLPYPSLLSQIADHEQLRRITMMCDSLSLAPSVMWTLVLLLSHDGRRAIQPAIIWNPEAFD